MFLCVQVLDSPSDDNISVWVMLCFSVCVCLSVCVPVIAGCCCVELLYRSDFFPGLGWMLLRETWLELRDKWPAV